MGLLVLEQCFFLNAQCLGARREHLLALVERVLAFVASRLACLERFGPLTQRFVPRRQFAGEAGLRLLAAGERLLTFDQRPFARCLLCDAFRQLSVAKQATRERSLIEREQTDRK